ncbi:MAG: hypothetical protein IJE70_05540 [Oscillospiraceae bacterium]|nr:hypothetical protein [Oscillospiraceae bacterium]
MRNLKKAGMVLLFVVPAIVGFIGYLLADNTMADSAYMAIKAYLFDADTFNNNSLIEVARWTAPMCTVSGLAIILKTAFTRLVEFFLGFASDAVAVYGDADLKEIVKKNVKHAINVDDNEVLDVNGHIILFSTDEKGIEFYRKNKERLCGDVFIKLDKNDVFSVALDDVKFFNPCEIVARSFWQENDIRSVIKNDRMKISIVGSDVLSRKILSYGLLNNIYSLTQKIEYHVWSDDDFFPKAHGDFSTMNGDRVVYHSNKCEERLFEIASSDRIIITEKINNEFLAELAQMTKGEIYCYDPMGTFVNIFDNSNIFSFGQYESVLTEENIRTDYLYDFAKKLNYQYTLRYSEDKDNLPSQESAWRGLDTFSKGSNIASADYHKIRLIVMKETGKIKVDDALAEMEHIRWCRYHLLNHWKYGETANGKKDTTNKIHPCLKPFAELDREQQLKDSEGIEVLLSLEEV